MSSRSELDEPPEDLNLIPIMNMVLIVIPILLVTASFVIVGVLEVASPRNAQAVTPEDQEQEEELTPALMVSITEEGFILTDMRQSPSFAESALGFPVPECGGSGSVQAGQVPITVCLRPGESGSLLTQLSYRGLYNRLVEIRNYPGWSSAWTPENSIINIVAEREVPFEVVVRTMDVARHFLEQDMYDSDEAFFAAEYRNVEGNNVDLFPAPVLLLPRPAPTAE